MLQAQAAEADRRTPIGIRQLHIPSHSILSTRQSASFADTLAAQKITFHFNFFGRATWLVGF